MADTASSPHSSAFVKLPRELLDGIASFLPTRDFNNLRLSCKQVENVIFPYWANCFFKVRQFMITDFSLNTLLDISRHPVLSKVMVHLAIGLNDLSRAYSLGPFNQPFIELNDLDFFNSASDSQRNLFHAGEAIRILAAALANLPNLKYVDIRNYSSPTRYRDEGFWRSYGISAYRSLLLPVTANGLVPPPRRALEGYTRDPDFVDKVFQVVITALGQASSSCPVRRLDLIIKDSQIALRDHSFLLVGAADPGLRAMLENLTTLHLNLFVCKRVYHLQPSGLGQHNMSTVHLQRFLTLTPNLTWLRLNSQPNVKDQASDSFFRWLALPPGKTLPASRIGSERLEEFPIPSIALPLRRLELGAWQLPIQLWTSLLRKHTGLEHFSLFRTAAFTENHSTAASDSRQESLWAGLIRKMPAITPRLKSIQLVSIMEGEGMGLHNVLFYGRECDGGSPRPDVVLDIDGEDALKQMADSCVLSSVFNPRDDAGQFESDDSGSDSSIGDSIDSEDDADTQDA